MSRPITFSELFPGPPVVGVVHLLPLPGSPLAFAMEAVVERALLDVRRWFDGGADAVVVENFGDAPYFPDAVPPVTVAAFGRVLGPVVEAARGPVGVNVLRNDAAAALSLAAAFDLAFLRVNVHAGAAVTDQGLIQGRAPDTLRLRAHLPGHPLILADLRVKHAAPVVERPLVDEAADLWQRAGADALLLTGPATGRPPDLGDLDLLHAALPNAPFVLASGVTPDLIRRTAGRAAGWLVGTYAKEGGRTAAPPDPERVRQLVAARPG